MRLSARPVACVALMQMGFVHHIETFGRESFAQLFYDLIFCGHDLRNIARYPFRSMTVSIAIHYCCVVYSATTKNWRQDLKLT